MSATSLARRNREWVLAASVIVLALILRTAALWWEHGHLAEDRDDYLVVATQYVAHGFWSPFERMPNSFRPPLFPLLVAAIYKAGGGFAALGGVQLILGVATVALTLRIGRQLGLGSLSIVAGLFVAMDPLLVEYTTFPMTETLFTFLVVLLIAVELWATGPAWYLRAAVLGVVFGGCALCRPTIWPVAALAALWSVYRAWRRQAVLGRLLLQGAVTALATALVVSPWVVRNWKLLGSPVLTTTHGGYTLLLGNNEEFFRQVAARPLLSEWKDSQPDRYQRDWYEELTTQMERELGLGAGEVAQDRWMYRRAWRSIEAEPRLFLRACVLRFAEFWNVVPLAPSRSTVSGVLAWTLGVGYSIELALFVAGAATFLWRWDDRWSLPLLLAVNFTLVHLFYWSNMRMRAPLVPVIALMATRVFVAWRDRRKVNKHVEPGPPAAPL